MGRGPFGPFHKIGPRAGAAAGDVFWPREIRMERVRADRSGEVGDGGGRPFVVKPTGMITGAWKVFLRGEEILGGLAPPPWGGRPSAGWGGGTGPRSVGSGPFGREVGSFLGQSGRNGKPGMFRPWGEEGGP